MTPRRIIDV